MASGGRGFIVGWGVGVWWWGWRGGFLKTLSRDGRRSGRWHGKRTCVFGRVFEVRWILRELLVWKLSSTEVVCFVGEIDYS